MEEWEAWLWVKPSQADIEEAVKAKVLTRMGGRKQVVYRVEHVGCECEVGRTGEQAAGEVGSRQEQESKQGSR